MIPAAYDVHERVRRDGRRRRVGRAAVPDVPALRRHAVPRRPTTRTSRSRWCGRGTTGCSTSGARRTRSASSRRRSIPLWDVPAAVAEIERCAAKGSRAVLFVENPHPLGLPSFPTGHWRPVFEACNATGLPLSMHIGTSSGLLSPSPETHAVGRHRAVRRQLDERARRPDLQRHVQRPAELQDRAVRGRRGLGAVRARTARLHVGAQPLRRPRRTTAPPSEVFAQHIWVCMIADRYAIRNRDLIGVDKIMWEADFPHNDSNWPNSRKMLADAMLDVPDDEAQPHRRAQRPRAVPVPATVTPRAHGLPAHVRGRGSRQLGPRLRPGARSRRGRHRPSRRLRPRRVRRGPRRVRRARDAVASRAGGSRPVPTGTGSSRSPSSPWSRRRRRGSGSAPTS